jgi:hypothetical protein
MVRWWNRIYGKWLRCGIKFWWGAGWGVATPIRYSFLATAVLCMNMLRLTCVNLFCNWFVSAWTMRSNIWCKGFSQCPFVRSFRLWNIFQQSFKEPDVNLFDRSERIEKINVISPLQFASMTGLADEVQRLLSLGFDPNCTSIRPERNGGFITPLHLAVCRSLSYLNTDWKPKFWFEMNYNDLFL